MNVLSSSRVDEQMDFPSIVEFNLDSAVGYRWTLPNRDEVFDHADLAELSYCDWVSLVDEADRHKLAQAHEDAIAFSAPVALTYKIYFRGKLYWFHEKAQVEKEILKGYLQDVTEICQGRDELEKRVKLAETSDGAKLKFLSNMSHELKTPLHSILGYSEILEEEALEKGDLSLGYKAKDIAHAGQHLLDLINKVLNYAKLETGKLQVEPLPFGVADLLFSVDSVFQNLFRRKDLEFETIIETKHVEFVSDFMQVKQILFNYLSNALKFTDEGKVTLRITDDPEDPSLVMFFIEDTGIGVEEDEKEKLFDSFYQAPSSASRSYGGSGLGLSLVKGFAQALGGDAWLVKSDKDGSCFACSIAVYLDL